MKVRPILFSAPMVRAILDGRKTQTRRAARVTTHAVRDVALALNDKWRFGSVDGESFALLRCPYGVPGDRLWVRETWQTWLENDQLSPSALPRDAAIQYPASYDGWISKRRPSIHMPRWASRITLEVTGVRVERLENISESDAVAEGLRSTRDDCAWHVEDDRHRAVDPRESYASLWESINGAGSWDANPWVWVVEFKRIKLT